MRGFIEVLDAAEQLAGGPNCSDEEFEMWVGLLRANLLRLGALAPSTGNFLSFLPPTGPWVPVTQLDLDCNRYCGDGALRLRIPVARFDAWRAENGFRPQTAAPAVDARSGKLELDQTSPMHGDGTVRHSTRRKRAQPLDAEIDAAKLEALDPNDARAVFAVLQRHAEAETGSFLGFIEGEGCKYRTPAGRVEFFNFEALRRRMKRAAKGR